MSACRRAGRHFDRRCDLLSGQYNSGATQNFCKNCGALCAAGKQFCANCGAVITQQYPPPRQQPYIQQQTIQQYQQPQQYQKNKTSPLILFGLPIAAVVIVVIFIFTIAAIGRNRNSTSQSNSGGERTASDPANPESNSQESDDPSIEYPDGSYLGDMSYDVRSGFGVMTFNNGDVYEGYWENDEMSGEGTFTWANGDVYTGNWVNNARSGFGVMTFANGDKQEGMWAGDTFLGQEIPS